MMSAINIDQAVERLHARLPLRARQAALPPELRAAHRHVLYGFATSGRPPGNLGRHALERLAAEDLVVLDAQGRITGAYPFTLEETNHRVMLDGVETHAMCALDALAIAPLFDSSSRVSARCAVSGEPVLVRQRGEEIIEHSPRDLLVGVRWVTPSGHAAHSLCRDMVFLADEASAAAWRGRRAEPGSVFRLEQAAVFGHRFFAPLLAPSPLPRAIVGR